MLRTSRSTTILVGGRYFDVRQIARCAQLVGTADRLLAFINKNILELFINKYLKVIKYI
jgi:hypothetical protein